MKRIVYKIKNLCKTYYVKSGSCDCGDKTCKREVVGTKEGALYVKNMFTCGKVKKTIAQFLELNRLKRNDNIRLLRKSR